MNESEFKAALLQEGFDDIEVRTIAANVHNRTHSHAFDVRALMIAGELTLSAQGKPAVKSKAHPRNGARHHRKAA